MYAICSNSSCTLSFTMMLISSFPAFTVGAPPQMRTCGADKTQLHCCLFIHLMTICYVILSAKAKSFSKSVKATRAELNNMSTPSTVHASLVLLVQVNCKCVVVSFWLENQAAITSFARFFFDKIVPCCCFVLRKEKKSNIWKICFFNQSSVIRGVLQPHHKLSVWVVSTNNNYK